MKKFFIILMALFLLAGCKANEKNSSVNDTNSNIEKSEQKESKEDENNKEEANKLLADMTFEDSDGKKRKIEEFKGKIMIISFWQTSCTYCRLELPEFDELQRENDDIKIIPIAVGEGPDAVNEYLKKENLSLESFYDKDMEIARNFGINGFPTNIYLNPDGTLVGALPGYREKSDVENILNKIREDNK